MARNNKTCAPPYSARKDSCEFSTACAEDTKCSPAGHPTFGQLAEIEAFVAHADRPLSTCQECGFHTTRPRPSNTTFKTLANGSRRFDQRDREWKGSGSLPGFMPVMAQSTRAAGIRRCGKRFVVRRPSARPSVAPNTPSTGGVRTRAMPKSLSDRSEKPPDAPCHAGARRNPVGARNRNRRGAEMTTADQPEITKNKRC